MTQEVIRAQIEDQRRREQEDEDRARAAREGGGGGQRAPANDPGVQRDRDRQANGDGGGETIQEILQEYQDLVRAGNASNRATRLIRERLEAAGMDIDEINTQINAIFDATDPDTLAEDQARAAAGQQSSAAAGGSFQDEQTFNIFEEQERLDPVGVFTRFLNETLGTGSSFLRSGAQRQAGNLFNQFTSGTLGGLAGLGEDAAQFAGTDPALFFDFLKGQGPSTFFESDPRTALGNISDVFRSSGTPTPGSVSVDEFFINQNTGLTNQGRVGGAIGSPLLSSISPFLRSSFQGGIGDQLQRLLASNPDANPFAAFQQGGFF